MGEEAKARLLLNLPNLSRLTKGDWLCDALGWIDYWEEEVKLLVNEFFPSQKYYFHEDWQMEQVSTYCPYIARMYFIFHDECCPNFLVLEPFEYLTELDLFGGSFYKVNSLQSCVDDHQ